MTEADIALPFPHLEQSNPPKRPRSRGSAINRLVAKDLLADVIEWLGDDFKLGGEPEIENQLFEALDRAFSMDGFQLAQRLSERGWDCDATLVETLDGASGCAWSARTTLVKAWVSANGITLKLAEGAAVTTPDGPGVVVGLRPDTAEYVVQTDQWLAQQRAVSSWDPIKQKGSGLIIAAEQLASCE